MRRRMHVRRAKRPVRWFSSTQGYLGNDSAYTVSSSSFTPTFGLLAIHPRQTAPGADLVTLAERQTIERIRGQIVYYGSADQKMIISMGIRVVELLPSGAPQPYSPREPEEAADKWMWLHHALVPNIASQGTSYIDSRVDVDIRTKRVLNENEACVLYLASSVTFPDELNGDVFVHPFLRMLVSRPA